MKNNYLSLLFIFLASMLLIHSKSYAQKLEIDFQKGSWYEIVDMAKSTNKFIFVDVYADYCPPCKLMDTQVFPNRDVAVFYNEHFINYKINISNNDNTYIEDFHNIQELPALLYFTPDGATLIKKDTGCKEVHDFLAMGVEVARRKSNNIQLVSTNPRYAQMVEYRQRYEKKRGNLMADDLYEYAYLLKEFHQPYNRIVNDYLLSQNRKLRSDKNREFIFEFATNLENLAIDYFVKDANYFKKLYGGKRINERIKTSIYNSIYTAINEHDHNLFGKAESILSQVKISEIDKFTFEMKALFYQGIADWDNYAKVSYRYLSDKRVSDPELLSEVASNFQKHVSNKKMLKSALQWSKKSIKIENEYYNNNTYAALLYKTGKTSKAIKAAEKAVHIAKLRGIDYKETLKLLDRMQSQQMHQALF